MQKPFSLTFSDCWDSHRDACVAVCMTWIYMKDAGNRPGAEHHFTMPAHREKAISQMRSNWAIACRASVIECPYADWFFHHLFVAFRKSDAKAKEHYMREIELLCVN